jgi:23S rRNA G2069 N7-methylase RlmK/C1962 C5-methylase RlmI
LEKDTAYQREVAMLQDSLKREALNRKKSVWTAGTVISGYVKYQCGFLSFGETTKVKGIIIDWQDDSIVLQITQYFDEEKKKGVLKCNDIKDEIIVVHDYRTFRVVE